MLAGIRVTRGEILILDSQPRRRCWPAAGGRDTYDRFPVGGRRPQLCQPEEQPQLLGSRQRVHDRIRATSDRARSVGGLRSWCMSKLSQSGSRKALDMDALHSGADTVLFAACVNDAGRVVGGLRARGPFQSADECHALLEWSGQPGQDAVRKMVTDRLPFGVVEMKRHGRLMIRTGGKPSRRHWHVLHSRRWLYWTCNS